MRIERATRALTVSTTDRNITVHAGVVLLRETARLFELGKSVNNNLHLKERARGLSEEEFVPSMTEAIAMGATCLDDLAVARSDGSQQELRGFATPPPQTAGSFLRRFSLGHIRQLDKALRDTRDRSPIPTMPAIA